MYICLQVYIQISEDFLLDPVLNLKDWEFLVSKDMSWKSQIASMVSRGGGVMCWVLSIFGTKEPTPMLILHKSLIRSNLE